MARKRYKNHQSSWSSRPSILPQKPEFHALLDLIDANREALPRRAPNTLNGYLQTLESNLQTAQLVIHSPAFVSQEREAALRLTLAQAALTRKQEQRNAVHQAASLPARWFGRSIPAELQRCSTTSRKQNATCQLSKRRRSNFGCGPRRRFLWIQR
jgi:hypothetical protein